MLIGQVIAPGSKLALTRGLRSETASSALAGKARPGSDDQRGELGDIAWRFDALDDLPRVRRMNYRFRWSGHCRMAQLDPLEHPDRRFGPMLESTRRDL
jgi:hypothetical protein